MRLTMSLFIIALTLIIGCNRSPANFKENLPTSTSSKSVSNKESETIGIQIFLSLLNEWKFFPEIDPVEKLGQSPLWKRLDKSFSLSMGSSSSFYMEQNGVKIIMGGSGSSDIFSVVVEPGGSTQVYLEKLNQVLEVTGPIGKQAGIGDTMSLYIARQSSADLGIISFIESTNKKLIGKQLVLSFMSKDRCITEGLWPYESDSLVKDNSIRTSPKVASANTVYSPREWELKKVNHKIFGECSMVSYGTIKKQGDLLIKADDEALVAFKVRPGETFKKVVLDFVIVTNKKLFRTATIEQVTEKSEEIYSSGVQVKIDKINVHDTQKKLRYSINTNGSWYNALGATLSTNAILSGSSSLELLDSETGYCLRIEDLRGIKQMIKENNMK